MLLLVLYVKWALAQRRRRARRGGPRRKARRSRSRPRGTRRSWSCARLSLARGWGPRGGGVGVAKGGRASGRKLSARRKACLMCFHRDAQSEQAPRRRPARALNVFSTRQPGGRELQSLAPGRAHPTRFQPRNLDRSRDRWTACQEDPGPNSSTQPEQPPRIERLAEYCWSSAV